MIKNHFKTALRNLLKRKKTTILNALGLIIGMVSCLLIFQYVSYEKSFDTFQEKSSQIYRVRLDEYKEGKLEWQSATSYPGIGPTIKREYKEVENYCRLMDKEIIFSNTQNNITYKEKKGYYADPSAITMLGVQLLHKLGNKMLDAPNQVIISEKLAMKYFRTTNAIGKSLRIHSPDASSESSFQVTGVFKEYPTNAHLIIDYLISYETLVAEMRAQGDNNNSANTSFSWYDIYTYIQLNNTTEIQSFEEKLSAFTDKYINSQQGFKENRIVDKLALIALPDIHLYSNANQEAEMNGNGKLVYFLFLIAIFIIIIAWVNYINLSTARSVERAKEVGIRKVVGASRRGLIRQFTLESILLNLLALIFALVIAWFLCPLFNSMMGRVNDVSFRINLYYTILFFGIFTVGTLVSGLYPAFQLSAYKPVSVLKGVFKNTAAALSLRKALIILQFSISIFLIIGTIIVYQQVQYMRKQSLGLNIQQTLVLEGARSVKDSLYQGNYQTFKNELLKLPHVKGVTASTDVMGQEIYWTRGVKKIGPETNDVTFYLLGIDYDFVPQFDLKLLEGRNLSKEFISDEHGKSVLINENGLSRLGFKNAKEAVGQQITMGNDPLTIVGVLKNYHHLGLQRNIDPQLFLYRPNARNSYSIKLSTNDIADDLTAIKEAWKQQFPEDPFKYFFLDDFFNQQYKADQQFGSMFTVFSLLAILIASFGLLGLSSYNILLRTKEIGIRRVLGASIKQIVYVLSKDFMLLIMIAIIIAVPIAIWVMSSWLQGYAYRIQMSWLVFAGGSALAVCIAIVTVGAQAIKAAINKPVTSLRND